MKKQMVAIGLCALLVGGMVWHTGQTSPQTVLAAEDLVLHVGSPLVLSGNTVHKLDAENYGVTPIIEQGRTLVPLRALAEQFGAKVSYDPPTSTITISTLQGRTATLKIGENTMDIDGTTFSLDAPATLREGRAMVPLRALAEHLLGKTVSYEDRVIVIGDTKVSLSKSSPIYQNAKEKIGAGYAFSSMTELKSYLKEVQKTTARNYSGLNKESASIAQNDGASAATGATPAAAEESVADSHSETNVQVSGVDEGDIVKTDGKYLYICTGRTLSIVDVSGKEMRTLSKTGFAENVTINELYLDGTTLVAVGSRYENKPIPYAVEEPVAENAIQTDTAYRYAYMPYWKDETYVAVYDLSKKQAPKLVRENALSGSLVSSRKVGDILYLVTNDYPYSEDIVLPTYKDLGKTASLPVEKLTCIADCTPETLTTVMAIDVKHTQTASTVCGLLGSGYEIYMNQKALYIAATDYKYSPKMAVTTRLLKLDMDGLNMGYAASGEVMGSLLNQFSMDEHNGNFRIATTEDSGNHLFVLDDSLNPVGSVKNLAPGERIYAVRYIGNTAYVVTFVETDPLFVIDLTEPTAPKVMGELKIPGFSNYLHPVGEHLLLGIGRDTNNVYSEDRNGNRTDLWVQAAGIKLSLFDVTDPKNPKETDELVLGQAGSWAEVLYDHKALMTDPANHRYGFAASITENNTSKEGALVFTINGRKLNLTGLAEPISTGDGAYLNRMVAVGDKIYYLYQGAVNAYNAETLSPLGVLQL